jgi:hypothetical protein
MTVSIRYEENGGYVIISGEGEITPGIIRKYAHKVMHEINRHNCHKILEDYRQVELKMNTFQIMMTQEFQEDFTMMTQRSPLPIKRALVTNDLTVSSDDLRYFKSNKEVSGHIVRIFNNYNNAIEWLIEEEKD